MKKRFVLAASLVAALTLTACGGGGDDSTFLGASQDLVISMNPATGPNTTAAVANDNFVFPTGVSEFGTTGLPTTLTWNDTSATPAFTIAADGSSATGVTEFGSCRFRVLTSSFPAPSPLFVGNVIVINSCVLTIRTRLQPADGAERLRELLLRLNTAQSNFVFGRVRVNSDGTVILNDRSQGTVTTNNLTGGA